MFAYDDIGNADRYAETYADLVRYVPQFKKWLVWDGVSWRVSLGEHVTMATDMVRSMHDEAALLLVQGSTLAYKDLVRHITRSAGKIDTILKLAAAREGVRTDPSWLDSDRGYLNCKNATVDLRDGQVRPHQPSDLITKVTSTAYLPGVSAGRWEDFLAQVLPDPEVREYVQRLAGYSLLGNVQERIMVFLHGDGRNGKSVFVETLRYVLGDYAIGTPVTTFLDKGKNAQSNDLARLRGARFVAASEFEEGAKANIALLKQVTGDEKITARPLYGEYFDFPFEGTIWISTNHMPFVGVTQAVWDRIKIIDFPTRILEQDVDVNIKAKLQKEAPGILNWIVDGARKYLAHGLEEPVSVLLRCDIEKSDQNMLRDFMNDVCVFHPGAEVPALALYRTYTWWATQQGEKLMSSNTFGRRMTESGFPRTRKSSGNYYLGIRTRSEVMD